jgi:hypothetical protein
MFISDPHQNFKYFNPQKWFLSFRKYDPGCSSRISDPDADFLPIPDPGVKKAPDLVHCRILPFSRGSSAIKNKLLFPVFEQQYKFTGESSINENCKMCLCPPGTVALLCQASPRSTARAASETSPLPLLLPLTRRGPPQQHQATKTCRVELPSLPRLTAPMPRRLVTAWTACRPHRRHRRFLNEARGHWQERRQRDALTGILPNTSNNSSSSNSSSVMKSHSWPAWDRRCVTTLWSE